MKSRCDKDKDLIVSTYTNPVYEKNTCIEQDTLSLISIVSSVMMTVFLKQYSLKDNLLLIPATLIASTFVMLSKLKTEITHNPKILEILQEGKCPNTEYLLENYHECKIIAEQCEVDAYFIN